MENLELLCLENVVNSKVNSDNFKIKILTFKNDVSPDELRVKINSELQYFADIANPYYFDKDYIENYIFVVLESGQMSAIKGAIIMANETKHKVKDVVTTNYHVLIVLKKKDKTNDWKNI